METRIYSVEEIKNFFIQELLNKVDGKISKVSDHSVLNGVAFGTAKVFQKAMKDVALLESELFPEYAYGEYLDKIARRYGVSGRQGNTTSSVYVKLVAEPGSLYIAENCVFTSTEGITFQLLEDFTMGEAGYDYVELRSTSTGSNANVAANTINKVSSAPSGHLYVNNDIPASGGIDEEDDQSFLNRIIGGFNNFSFETLDKLTYVMQVINPLVLSVKKEGSNSNGQIVLAVVSANGGSFTEDELDTLSLGIKPYLSIADLSISNDLGGSISPVVLKNIDYTYIDIDFRVDLYPDIDINEFRISVQEQLSSFFDFRDWSSAKVDWEDLYYIVRGQSGIKSLPEQYFVPRMDIEVPAASFPRLRSFVMRDLNGVLIYDNNGGAVPLYYGPDYTENVLFSINNALI